MTIKTVSAIAVFAAAFTTAAFAQEHSADMPGTHRAVHARHVHHARAQEPSYMMQRGGESFLIESYGMDRSRPGDLDPDMNPAN
jgi:hypothetical protein